MTIANDKAAARKAAFQRRATADPTRAKAANDHLVEAIRNDPGRILSAYWPIRTELDPRPALETLSATHDICLPEVIGPGQPLAFREWRPGATMIEGAFGVALPDTEHYLTPDILVVPLAAFDKAGFRLGYGGGFYDRTLEKLREGGRITAIGLAYDIQECPSVPCEPTDQQLDLIVTESGIFQPEGLARL